MLCANLIYLDPVTIPFSKSRLPEISVVSGLDLRPAQFGLCFSINLSPVQHRGPNEQLPEVRTGS